MTSPHIPIPVSLTNSLSTRAKGVLIREGIESCVDLLGLAPDDLRRFKNCGASTVNRLGCLQEAILQEYPELSHYLKRQQVQLCEKQPVPEDPPNVPAEWSILNRTLPEIFRLSPPPRNQVTDPEPTIAGLGIPAADLERLRSTAIYPEDSIHLFFSVSLGYLIEANLTDDTLTVILKTIFKLCGQTELSPTSLASVQVSDLPLYPETDSAAWEALRVPDFCDPALLGSSTTSWREVRKLTERTVMAGMGFSATALRAIRHLWQLKALALALQKSAPAG